MDLSISVIIPTKNEVGTIQSIVEKLPLVGKDMEIVFVDGASTDGTLREIQKMRELFPQRNIRVLEQLGRGKADAVFQGIKESCGDGIIIYDSDMTVPPEDIVHFYTALKNNRDVFVNGSRFRRKMESRAMPILNIIANRFFSFCFSMLFHVRITDTLCGTKAFLREDFTKMSLALPFLDDPYGDFYFLFGAHALHLSLVEIPLYYKARVYGRTKINRLKGGLILCKLLVQYCAFYFSKKIKTFFTSRPTDV